MVGKLALIVLIICCSSCKQAEKEAERTKAQLSRLARDVGAEDMVDSVGRAYTENVEPAVKGAKDTADLYAKSVPAIEAAQEAGAAASENLTAMKDTVVRHTYYYASKMPDSEEELNRMIDYYNRQFATWLKNNFIAFDHQNFSERASVKTKYKPRTRPRR